jgi:hypothetical protein
VNEGTVFTFSDLTKLLDTIYVTGLPENVDLNTLYYYFSIPGPIKVNENDSL